MKNYIFTSSMLLLLCFNALSTLLYAQHETPSSHIAVVISPARWEGSRGETTFLRETGSPNGQRYITVSHQQFINPGLSPYVDFLDHIQRVDGTHSTGVLLHASHGGSFGAIMMESFVHSDNATAMAAAQTRLTHYGNLS